MSDCLADTECEEGKMCCLNNCNQRFCTEPRPVDSPPCRAIVDRLSANISYIPQCDTDGYYQPIQCSGEGENRMCWCVNVFSGVPFSRTTSDRDSLDCHSMFVNSPTVSASLSASALSVSFSLLFRNPIFPWLFVQLSSIHAILYYTECENSSYAPGERYDAEDGCNTWWVCSKLHAKFFITDLNIFYSC